MLIGRSYHWLESGYFVSVAGYTPSNPELTRRPQRSGNNAGDDVVVGANFSLGETFATSRQFDWVYFADVKGMVTGGLTKLTLTDGVTFTIDSVNLASGSPVLNDQNDILLSDGVKKFNVSGSSGNGSAALISTAAGIVAPLQPDWSFIQSGYWLNTLGQCPVIDRCRWDKEAATVTIDYRNLSPAQANEMIPDLLKYGKQYVWVLYDSDSIFGDSFLFRCVQLTSVDPEVKAGDIYSVRVTARVL